MSRGNFTAAQAAPAHAICFHCGMRKDNHGKMGYTCLVRGHRGKMFSLLIEPKTGRTFSEEHAEPRAQVETENEITTDNNEKENQ